MESNKDFRFQCTHCGNCCTDKNTIVNVTYHDILRIKNGLKLNIEEILLILGFYVFEKKPTQEELKRMVVPPIETENGPAFVGLFKKQSGACYFYDGVKKRCSIHKLRPNFCRTFPYSFKIFIDTQTKVKKGVEVYLTAKGYEYCEGISQDNPLIDKDMWVELGRKTTNSLEENNVLIKNWNVSVKLKKIDASARNFLLTIFNLEEKKLLK